VTIQPDGKIIVGGGGFELWRFNVDGTLDTTFDGTGVVKTSFAPYWDYENELECLGMENVNGVTKIIASG
jgi:hypothetical protein